MVIGAYDADALMLVGRYFEGIGPHDISEFIALMERVAIDGRKQPERPATILVIVEHAMTPSKQQTHRLHEVDREIPNLHFAVVAQSFIVRSFAMAMQMIAPSTPNRIRSTHAELQSAIAWFEELTPGAAPKLAVLAEQVGATVSSRR